jgi:hypothetical protein
MASNTNGATTPPKPKEEVFASAALFNEILARTTICDLAFTRQVCKAWHIAIGQSLLLQQELFLTLF